MRFWTLLGVLVAITACAIFLLSCSSSKTGTVNTTISDPPTCMAPQGPYIHVYVSITDVLIHQSASASPNDSGWVGLASNLKNSPVQVDLLGLSNQCFLATLGSAEVQPGNYQQIRVILASNGTSVSNNKCGVSANCVVLASDPANPQPLQLSSESQTGIKIPSGQLAGGQFTVNSGATADLNIDFDACASIVVQGNGQYRLKPVLHAGEVALTSASTAISGTIIDNVTLLPVAGGNTVVALEQPDKFGVDRVVMEAVPASSGMFTFCPVAAGTYDIVAVAINGVGNTYAATVITGVQAGDVLGNVPMTPANAPASITGQITTSTGSAATSADLTVSALQSIGGTTLVTVPLAQQSSATATLTTAANVSCPVNTDCANYTLSVPAANPSIGAFNSGGNQTPAAPALGTGNYTVDGLAFIPGSAGTPDCSSPDVNTTVSVMAGNSVAASTLSFTGCH